MQKRWRVLLLDTKRSNPNHYICLAIAKALESHPEVEAVYNVDIGSAVATAREGRCNLFLAFDGEELHPTICARLKQVCGLAVLWVTEDPYELPINLRNAKIFDRVYTNDSASVPSYGDTGAHLPLAADPEFHYRPLVEDNAGYRYDLFFAGTAWPNRVELLAALMDGIQGLKAKLAISTNPHLPPVNLDLPRSSFAWRTPNYEFANFANCTRAVLGLHRDFSTSPGARTIAATPGPRIFEVALAGGFQLVDGSLPEIGEYFEVGREIVVFNSPEECLHQLRHYLEHPVERIAIARAAQERAKRDHTYAARIERILTDANQLRAAEPEMTIAAQKPSSLQKPSRRPRVLMVTHNVIDTPPWGGVEVYQHMVATGLKDEYEVWFYSPQPHTGGQVCQLFDGEGKVVERISFETNSHPYLLSCPERERTFARLLASHDFEIVHFQHLLNHVPSLPAIARAFGVRSIISLHDYFFACHHFNLVGMTGEYCHVEQQPISGCDLCLARTLHLPRGSQSRRRAFFRQMLHKVDVLHANTPDVVARYKSVYGDIGDHAKLAIMGVPSPNEKRIQPGVKPRRPAGNLRVAIIGNFIRSKGAETLLPAIQALAGDQIEFTIFGWVDSQYKDALAALPNVHVHGPYKAEEVHDLISGCDVSVHVSIWPETYCITLTEAWNAGLVPIVADIGALGERVRHGENGFKFPAGNVGMLIEQIRTLATSPSLLDVAQAGKRAEDQVTQAQHLSWLRDVYAELVYTGDAPATIAESAELTLDDCGVFLNSRTWVEGALNPAPDTPAHIQHPGSDAKLVDKAYRYLRNHGVRATVRRIVAEAKHRLH